MQVRYENEVVNHLGPESCVGRRETESEALTGETTDQPLSREIISPGMPMLDAVKPPESVETWPDLRTALTSSYV